MDGPRHVFFLTNTIFFGFILSALYGAVSAAALYLFGHASDLERYTEDYFLVFNCAVSGGLVFATALLVYRTQSYIPNIIEKTFTPRELAKTSYYEQCREAFSLRKTVILSTGFAVSAGIIFYYAQFPLEGMPRYFLIAAGGLQYAAGVYIGRKIFYFSNMLRALELVPINKDIFSQDKLFGISLYVNSVSTMTAIAVYVGVRSYYYAPFQYASSLGESIKTAMLLPAVIAIPVLLFSYYYRAAIRAVYEKSIARSLKQFSNSARRGSLSDYEIRVNMLEQGRILRDELNYRLKTSLEDLPVVVIIGFALLSAIKA